jgi:hypothetical protein
MRKGPKDANGETEKEQNAGLHSNDEKIYAETL